MRLNRLSIKVMLVLAVSIIRGDNLIEIGNEPNLEGVSIGIPVTAGSGCSQGTVLPILDLENKQLIVLFDDYVVEAGGRTRVARKNCALSIPIHLPSGLGVALVSERIEGFNILPDGASSVLNTETFLAGSSGEVISTKFEGLLEEDFVVEHDTAVDSSASSCGSEDVNLRVNTSLRIKTNSEGDYALAGITALGESSNSLVYRLNFIDCLR